MGKVMKSTPYTSTSKVFYYCIRLSSFLSQHCGNSFIQYTTVVIGPIPPVHGNTKGGKVPCSTSCTDPLFIYTSLFLQLCML